MTLEKRLNFNIGAYFFALILDLLSFYGLALILSILWGLFVFDSYNEAKFYSTGSSILFIFWIFYFLVIFKRTGQTLGMKVFGVKVTSRNGNAFAYSTALLWAIAIPIFVTPLLESVVLLYPHETFIEKISDSMITMVS